MTESAPDARPVAGRRTLLAAAAWSVPVVAASIAAPLAAATTTQSAGGLVVSMTTRTSSPGIRADFSITPESAALPVPAGTLLLVELTQVHSRSWSVVSSQFDYQSTVVRDANGNPATDSVNAAYTASTYLTRHDFAVPQSFGVYFVPYRGQIWGARITATLPLGWTAGPGAVLVATAGPLYS